MFSTALAIMSPSERSEWLLAYGSLVSAVVLLNILVGWWRRLPVPVDEGIDLDRYQTAALRGDASDAVNTAIVHLVHSGVLRINRGNTSLEVCGPLPKGGHPLEEALFEAVVNQRSVDRHYSVVAVLAQQCQVQLRSLGLLPNRISMALGSLVGIGIVVLAFALFFNAGRLYDHPAVVGRSENSQSAQDGLEMVFILAAVVMGFAGLILGAQLSHGRTRRGQTLLSHLRQRHPASETGDLALQVALHGVDVLQEGDHAHLKAFLEPPPAPGSDTP